jgi:hypothetical protein
MRQIPGQRAGGVGGVGVSEYRNSERDRGGDREYTWFNL